MINIPSKKYQEWHEDALWQIRAQNVKPIKSSVKIELKIWYKDNRRKDSDNVFSSVSDLLCDAGIIQDDDWKTLPDIHIVSEGVDRNNPRVEIFLYPIDKA